jgi:hypothetical protein
MREQPHHEDPKTQSGTKKIQPKNLLCAASRLRTFVVAFQALPFVFLLLLAELSYLFFFRQVNLDEGWYLWASKLVYEGKLLYRDFAYTQTPVLPYVYGLGGWILGEGLYQGRVITLLFTLGAVALSVATARRIAGRVAAFCTLALLIVSPFALTQFTYTATYALAAFFLAASLYVATSPWPESWRIVLATGLAVLAVGVRLSMIVVLLPLIVYLAWTGRRWPWRALGALGSTLCWLALTLGIYYGLTGEWMRYDTLGFHTDRLLKTEWHRLRMWHMSQRTLADFLFLIGMTAAAGMAGAVQLWQARGQAPARLRPGMLLLSVAGMVFALFAVHLLPRTTDSYYNSLQTPLMALAGSVVLAQWLAQERPNRRRYLWVLIIMLLLAHGGRQWRALVRDQTLAQPPRNQIALVRESAALLRRFTTPGQMLLSFSPHLALEAGLRVLPGYEMAIFAYRPTWTDEEVDRYHVVNNRRLLDDLRAGAQAVAFTAFDLEQIAGERTTVMSILQEQYRLFATIPGFGPYGDELSLYLPPQFGDPQPQATLRATLASEIELLGFDQAQRESADGAQLAVALYWRANSTPSAAYTVFVQLLDANGARATGWDNPPCRSTCPTTSWQAGEFVRDEYTLSLAGLPPGTYTVYTGMYDAATGVRLPIRATDGKQLGDMVSLTILELQ